MKQKEFKKKKVKKKRERKCMVTKYRVTINSQWREFDTQAEARQWVKELIAAPIYFIIMDSVEVEGC